MNLSFAKIFYPLASCFFMLLLLLPLGDELFHFMPDSPNIEQRVLAKMPTFKRDSITYFPKGFEGFYKDNFGFRQPLINLGAKIKYTVFHSSPTPDKVSLGKNDFLFLTGRFYEITQDLGRENLYNADTLKRHAGLWESRKQELNAMHINYYKAFWPDKYYIYPENMSFWMELSDHGGQHKCDQAIAYLKQTNSPVQIIDVRDALLEAKKTTRIYHKNDSHWNSYGAFIAYTQLMNTLAKDHAVLKPYPLERFNVSWMPAVESDLAVIINKDEHEDEPVFTFKDRAVATKMISADGYPKKTKIYVNDSAATKLRALVYRDSYTSALIPFLMLHFNEVVFIWDTDYATSMVEKVKPDVVIECYATRYFR